MSGPCTPGGPLQVVIQEEGRQTESVLENTVEKENFYYA